MTNISSLTENELMDLMSDLDQPKFRAKQLYEWIHKHNASSYDEMTNLPKTLRDSLSVKFPLTATKIELSRESSDGSKRYLFDLGDGELVETVAMRDTDKSGDYRSHLTICVSSQVGCPMMCAFCATGRQGFIRNLTSEEIVSQVVNVSKDMNMRASNIVVMGQGEPFNNYDDVVAAIRRINTDPGINIGARHITISTSGIIKGIERFSFEPEQFRLAVSLHSAVQATRNMLMPKLESQTLEQLKRALMTYNTKKGRRITLEYLLLEDINDMDKELDALIDFCSGLNVHVNLLHYNASEDDYFNESPERVFNHWSKKLSSNGINVTVRKSRGSDISAACGQLRNEHK